MASLTQPAGIERSRAVLRRIAALCGALLAMWAVPAMTENSVNDDPYLWLEDVESPRALEWVHAQDAISRKELEGSPDFAPTRERLLSILESKARIPTVTSRGGYLYNFWQDAEQVRGIWRRTSPQEYRKPEPKWETVLDLDALAAKENESWVMKSIICLYPEGDRCLMHLSRGGGDAVVIREFDVPSKSFVGDGFQVPEAKTRIDWRDRDSVYVGTDFGAGTLTESGYPRIVKVWKRGTPLSAATTVFEAQTTDVAASAFSTDEPGFHREFLYRAFDFFSGEMYVRSGEQFVKVDVPKDATVGTFREQLLVRLRSDWQPSKQLFAAGSLISIPWDRFQKGERDFVPLFTPGPGTSLNGYATTRNHIILDVLDNVHSQIDEVTPRGTAWQHHKIPIPALATANVSSYDDNQTDNYFLTIEGFLTPATLYLTAVGSERREQLKSLPAFFDASGLEVSQRTARSKDGTQVPYFLVARKGVRLDGSNPVLLYAYGGFEVSQTPLYNSKAGAAWLERGGVYALANIRGGGEFGPQWHQSAIKENRQRVYDDMIAVAQSLIDSKITSPPHLGIMGGSNGGLLMGVMLTQRPDLFGAIVCQVPLLDMRRYHRLLAGASWMAEYGDPDKPQEWAYISKYSPYQNTRADVRYPRVLFTTSTRDDRVHPGHARKMAARLMEEGHDILFFENTEGGHAGAANSKQQAYMWALSYTFLWKTLR